MSKLVVPAAPVWKSPRLNVQGPHNDFLEGEKSTPKVATSPKGDKNEANGKRSMQVIVKIH